MSSALSLYCFSYKLKAQTSEDHGEPGLNPVFFIVKPDEGDSKNMLHIHYRVIRTPRIPS